MAALLALSSCTNKGAGDDLSPDEFVRKCPHQLVVVDEPAATVNRPLPSLTVGTDHRFYALVHTDDGPILKESGTSLAFLDAATTPEFDDPADPHELRNAVTRVSVSNGRYWPLDLAPGRYVVSSTNVVALQIVRC